MTYHTIQIEDALHIIPEDEVDLHAIVEPCQCKPSIFSEPRNPAISHSISTISLHNPVSE